MKHLKSFESKNYPTLYHYIPLYNLIKVFEEYTRTGKFLLKTDVCPERTNNKPVVSLSRNSQMNSVDLSMSKQLCRISFDGEKLSHRFKMKPYADSTYTKGIDGEEEEMLFLNDDGTYTNTINNQIPCRYEGDVTDCIIRIDILTKVTEVRNGQSGYVSWSDKYDDYNPKYLNRKDEHDDMQRDHDNMVRKLFQTIRENKIPFPVRLVKKFSNIKYQDRYIDKWNRRSYRYNKGN